MGPERPVQSGGDGCGWVGAAPVEVWRVTTQFHAGAGDPGAVRRVLGGGVAGDRPGHRCDRDRRRVRPARCRHRCRCSARTLFNFPQMPDHSGCGGQARSSPFAVNGASTTGFINAMNTAFAAFDAANPGYSITVNQSASYAGLIPAADASEAAGLGLTTRRRSIGVQPDVDRELRRQPDVRAWRRRRERQRRFLRQSAIHIHGSFGAYLWCHTDIRTWRRRTRRSCCSISLPLGSACSGENNFAATVGVLSGQITNGSIALTAQASAALANNPGAAQTISEIAGTNAANLLTVTSGRVRVCSRLCRCRPTSAAPTARSPGPSIPVVQSDHRAASRFRSFPATVFN